MTIKHFAYLASALLLLSAGAAAQAGRCRSSSVEKSVRCANVLVEFGSVTSSRLRGTVESPLDSPIVVEIYKIAKRERKEDPTRLADPKMLYAAIETDKNGGFCHPGLPDGYYLIRFGTTDGQWNCSYIKVHILRGSTDRRIKADLWIGT